MSPLFLLLTVALAPGQDWFYPGPGERIAMIESDGDGAKVGHVPVELTGFLLAHVDDPAAIRALPEVASVTALRGDGHVVRIRPRAGLGEIALSRTLHGRPGVRWAHPDFAVELVPANVPNDPYFSGQWHLQNVGQRGWTRGVDINAELAWTRSTGKGGLVAVIDTGVDFTHPDLKAVSGHDYVDNDEDASPVLSVDGAPHGTAVSGVAAAIGNNGIGVSGVAWDSSIYAIRLIGGKTTIGAFYDAVVEAVDAGAWVLSNSWGYGDKCDMILDSLGTYSDAMTYAETMGRGGLGAAVVFAAGNGNCDIKDNHLLSQPQIIVVAATNGDDLRESYSNFGKWVSIAAPSGTILTTDIVGQPGYGNWMGDDNYSGFFNGTSAATPVVSGVLLLMFAANPRLTAAQARQVLCATATKIDVANAGYDANGWSPYYGCGRVDAGAAVLAVANTAPAAPVIVAPIGTAYADHVVLRWLPAVDADHDWLTYRVEWHLGGADSFGDGGTDADAGVDGNSDGGSDGNTIVELPRGATQLDLTGLIALGQSATFTVQAVDLWGPGAASPPTTFAVIAHPVPPAPAMPKASGCGCDIGQRSAPPLWPPCAALALVLRRRRRLS